MEDIKLEDKPNVIVLSDTTKSLHVASTRNHANGDFDDVNSLMSLPARRRIFIEDVPPLDEDVFPLDEFVPPLDEESTNKSGSSHLPPRNAFPPRMKESSSWDLMKEASHSSCASSSLGMP